MVLPDGPMAAPLAVREDRRRDLRPLADRGAPRFLAIVRIGLIAPPWIPVPPPSYGGTEVVVDNLARGLAARGHDVRLFTVGESTCPVDRAAFFDRAVQPTGTTVAEAAHVLAAYEELTDCDVIHDHTMAGPLTWARTRHGPPLVTTNHGEFNAMTRLIYRAVGDRVAVVAISHSQRESAPEIPIAAVIHHGVDLDVYGYGPGGDYFLFVGRMNPDKGVADAIRLARRAGRRIVVVSKMWEEVERQYFEEQVRPLLGPDVELLPETSLAHKVELFQHAAALLNTIRWPEPFGLVMAEALACGTPVVGFPCGAAPEIVDHGVTGYLDTDEDALLRAPVEAIDRRACRAAAQRRFSIERMARDHEQLYERVVASRLRVA
jgi:glycosyltransferase involved in cell wall biosynthesis